MATSDKSVDLKRWADGVARNMEMFKEGAEMMVRDHQSTNHSDKQVRAMQLLSR